jgi:hypothetical protein
VSGAIQTEWKQNKGQLVQVIANMRQGSSAKDNFENLVKEFTRRVEVIISHGSEKKLKVEGAFYSVKEMETVLHFDKSSSCKTVLMSNQQQQQDQP